MDEIKPKILFITTQLPYPPNSGGVIKSWKLIQYLSMNYDVTLACFLKNDDRNFEQEFLQKIKLADYIAMPQHIPRTAINLIKSNALGIPLNLYRNRNSVFKEEVKAIANGFEILFIDHYEMFQFVPKDFLEKVVLHQHNCEYLMWQRFSEIEKTPLKKLALRNQAYRIKNYEQKICKRASTILAAPNDIEELVAIGALRSKFFPTYHLGDEELLLKPPLVWNQNNKNLLYIGTLTWEANVDGLIWFIENIWPIVVAKEKDAKLCIVGQSPDNRILQAVANAKNIEVKGFVKDLEDVFLDSKVFVSPLRFGSGIKVKVMNALYRGIPCVTTSIGSEGLLVEDMKHILIAENEQQYAEKILLLLKDKALWQKINQNSRTLAANLYTWEAVFRELENAIN